MKLVPDGIDLVESTTVVKDLMQHRRLNTRMDTGHRDMTPIRINRQIVSPRRIRKHSVIQPKKSTTASQEVPRIFKEVETNLVCIEHTAEQVLPTPERTKDFRTWEGSVKEDANLGHGDAPS
mmetsp:Transcript_4786/g.10558  ORF Transcript_4786/g.10558 Transcript_4786/m.10558 type:complete len:122 (-) Transcript_4786:106-471(-)